MKFIKIFLPFIVILFLSFWAIKPFFLSGFFPIHDDTQVARVYEMSKSLQDGMFPVRWVTDLGYNFGYPIFNFYAPLAYYVGGVFNLLGFDSLIATKIMMSLGIVFAGIFMYLFAKQFWGTMGGIIAALLYIYAPYHAIDIYVRGDTAEFWAYMFIPLVFYGLWKTYLTRKWKDVCIASIGYAGIILSHNLTAMMLTPFILVTACMLYFFARKEKKLNKPYLPLLVLISGLLLASFYWVPVFAEMKYTNVLSQVGGGADYNDHFVCLTQLWNSPWGFGGSTPTCIDGLSYKIGKLHIILALFAVVGIILFWKENREKFSFILLFFLSLFFSIFLMLQPSKIIWDLIPQMAFFQYPWRFLLITSFFVSFLGGSSLWVVKQYMPSRIVLWCLTIIVALTVLFVNAELFVPQMYLNKTTGDYLNRFVLTWTTSKISDEYMPKNFIKPSNYNEVPSQKLLLDKTEILSLKEKTNLIHVDVLMRQKKEVPVNLAYFPGWHVFIDGEQTWFKYANKGLIISLPQGKHSVDIKFIQTPIEVFANVLSITGVILLIIGIIYSRKQNYEYKKA